MNIKEMTGGRRAILTMVLFACFGGFAGDARATWGGYDTTFGFSGWAIDSVANHYPTQVAQQPDGKILVTGYKLVGGHERFFLRRYLSNGSLDTSFGTGGAAVSNALIVENANYRGMDIEVMVNGKITVAGRGNGYPAIWRFSSSGNGDATVGIGGLKVLSTYEYPSNLDSVAQGNTLIVGAMKDGQSNLVLVRLGSNGSLDSSFGFNGEITSSNIYGGLYTLKVEAPGNKVTVGGTSLDQQGFGLERWMSDGQIDGTFNFADQNTGQASASRFVKLANGKYVMPQWWYGIPVSLPSVSKLTVFDSSGLFESGYAYEADPPPYAGSGYPCPFILAQQQDGRLLIRGQSKIFRFDTALNIEATNTCSAYTSLLSPTPAILQSDDKMLAAGRYNNQIALVRTLPN